MTLERPGGAEIERQSFDDLEQAKVAADGRVLAYSKLYGSTIAKVRDEAGNEVHLKVCG
ncbi:hypothetical protein [Sphingomonas sp.]|uniref:hypothetical protein n=1 Tax=Sphingomonas sp. TaxID=28214 RepID=UPI003B002632